MSIHRPSLRLLAHLLLLPVVLLGFAACDSDDPDPDPDPLQDIVELAQATPQLSTLVTALTEADLVATLQGDGPFTVFAPVNSAFGALGSETVGRLLEDDNQALLQKVLTYHVVPGRLLAADLTDGQTLTTVEGSTLTIDLSDGASVNGAALTRTDILASNGVVHLIDAVLTENLDIVDVATLRGFETLVTALGVAGRETTLRGDGPFTVFAPTEAAFGALPDGTLEALLADPTALANVLTYHVVADEVFSSDLSDGQMLKTVQGGTVEVMIDGSTIGVAGVNNETLSTIVAADVAASNGVIHAIDTVLLPPNR